MLLVFSANSAKLKYQQNIISMHLCKFLFVTESHIIQETLNVGNIELYLLVNNGI